MIDSYTLDQLKSGLTTYVNMITKPDRRAGKNKYQCPLCGSGTKSGRESDGAFHVNGNVWYCFSCEEGGDIFKLIEKYEKITDFNDQLKRAAEITGVRLNLPAPRQSAAEDFKEDKKEKAIKGRYKEYIERCKAAAPKTDYFKSRGFSEDTVERFNLGYDEKKRAIVIPYDRDGSYYITRDIKTPINQKEGRIILKPKKEEAGQEPIYNKAALYNGGKPCFVCESPIDAISIIVSGAGSCSAVSVGGTGHGKLIDAVKEKKPTCMLILSFDTDGAGQGATRRTAEDLKPLGVPFIVANYSLDAYPDECRKDANDFLRGNPEQLRRDIALNIEDAEKLANAEKAALLEAHKASSAAERLKDFVGGIKEGANTSYTPTGFSELDKELDGGLYNGLYILGAISSLGKTTFLLQIADQIAEAGKDILYFSLEMGASELISKSLSRLTYQNCAGAKNNAKTARGITTASRYKSYSRTEKELIEDVIALYGEYAEHIYLYEGIGDIGVEQIRKLVADHKDLTGEAPVVFIDYLQILAPYDMRASDKQNTDKAVLELKRLSRDYKIPIIAISSFNRDNYTSEVNMSAFKESGAIEYGSDVLIALQPQGMQPGYTKTEQKKNADLVKKCKASAERSVEAVILKNRNGKTGGKVGFVYYSLFNCFTQDYGFSPVDTLQDYDEDDLIPFGADD